MASGKTTKALAALLLVAVAVIAWRMFSPASTRDEARPAGSVPELAQPYPNIPDDVLRIPEGLRAYPGLGDHPDGHYWYLPYAVLSDGQGIAMVAALRKVIEDGRPFPGQLPVPNGQGARGREVLYPTEPGVGRFYISDTNNPQAVAEVEARIPLVISQSPPGARTADVLFLDGHRESVELGRFPLGLAFIEALSALDPPDHAAHGDG